MKASEIRYSYKKGFTLIELLSVLVILVVLSSMAVPAFLNLRFEAEAARAVGYLENVRTSIVMKKVQLNISCHQPFKVWPRLEAILMNDITEGGAIDADCSPSQIPKAEDRRFLAQGTLPIPVNPYNKRNDLIVTSCHDLCSCTDEAGYLYNPDTGQLGHKLLNSECAQSAR